MVVELALDILTTGYGQQTALFAPRLTAAGHPIGVISTYGHQGNPINWQNVQVFGSSYHPYAMDVMHSHSITFKADALVTLIDLQVMELEGLQGTAWTPWFPVDHETIPPIILEKVKHADHPITMSKHASGEMEKAGFDYSYVPCAFDPSVYKPLDRAACREALQFPLDKFIVGMVAMNKGNPSRKAFHQNIAAFAELKKKHDDVVFYIHTGDGMRGGFETENLVVYCHALGLKIGYAFTESAKTADIIFADQYGMVLGYDLAMMAQIYNAFDVYCGVTLGEGFGIPIIEAQACGTPVIVGDWTSMSELCFSGWKVDKKDTDPVFTNLYAFQYRASIQAIADKLEMSYRMRGNQDYRRRAHDGVKGYEVDRVLEKYWLPAIARIDEKIKTRRDDLLLNLEVLR